MPFARRASTCSQLLEQLQKEKIQSNKMPNHQRFDDVSLPKRESTTLSIGNFWEPSQDKSSSCRMLSLFLMLLMAFAFLVSWFYYVNASVRLHAKYEKIADTHLEIVDAGKKFFEAMSDVDSLEDLMSKLAPRGVAKSAAAAAARPLSSTGTWPSDEEDTLHHQQQRDAEIDDSINAEREKMKKAAVEVTTQKSADKSYGLDSWSYKPLPNLMTSGLYSQAQLEAAQRAQHWRQWGRK